MKKGNLLNVFEKSNLKTYVTLPTVDEINQHPECLRMTDLALLCGAKPTTVGFDQNHERCLMGQAWTATAGDNGKTMQNCAWNGVGFQEKMTVKQSNPAKIKGLPLVIVNPQAAGFALKGGDDTHGFLTYHGEYCYVPSHAVSGEWAEKFTKARLEGYLDGHTFDVVTDLEYDPSKHASYETYRDARNFGEAPSFLGTYYYDNEAYAPYGKPGDSNFNWLEYDKIYATQLSKDKILLPILCADMIDAKPRNFIDRINAPVNVQGTALGRKLNNHHQFLKTLAESTVLNQVRSLHRAEPDKNFDY